MATIISLSILGIVILFLGIIKKQSWLLPVIFSGLIISLVLTITMWNTSQHYFNEMMIFDNYAVAFNAVMIFTTFLIFMFAGQYYKNVKRPLDDIFAILIFALTGCIMMTSFGNMVILFLGLETLSIALYVLAGSHKEAITSNEATLKYFLLGSFLSGFLLFGIALIYGASGSFDLQGIADFCSRNQDHIPPMFKTGLFLLIIGLAFKIAIVPFHFWAPDVYEGTPTLLTAFMATVVKTASIVALYRLFSNAFPAIHGEWETLLWILAVLTILLGNITGIYQPNLKRMLAYSSISHSGYMLLAVLAFSPGTANALLVYTLSYSLATVNAFGILILVRAARGNDDYSSFEGMSKKNKVEAFSLTIALLSLTGIPPLVGFVAKYYLFAAAIDKGFIWLVLLSIFGSAISAAYYFKPIIAIYLKPGDGTQLETTFVYKTHLLFLTGLIILLGLMPFLISGLL
ncbi:MAG: NADH-quinone oxidoreductase subunit N [Bacteroidota bacterium]